MFQPAGIKDTLQVAGFVVAPAAGAAIATIAAPGAGWYRLDVVTHQSGTPDALSANLEVRAGSRVVGTKLLSTALAIPVEILRVRVEAGEAITVNAVAIGTGQYNASITATQVA